MLNNLNVFNSMTNWYQDLKEYTPKTYFTWDIERLPDIPYVVKGKTNSRKHNWNTQMYCPDKSFIINRVNKLLDDSLISDQGVVVREYIELEKLDEGINGLPISNEWRCFFYKNKLLTGAFYWSNFEDSKPYEFEQIYIEAKDLLDKVANIVSEHINFWVVDIGKTENGEWIVIELNDGQMSGLSLNKPEDLYSNLFREIS